MEKSYFWILTKLSPWYGTFKIPVLLKASELFIAASLVKVFIAANFQVKIRKHGCSENLESCKCLYKNWRIKNSIGQSSRQKIIEIDLWCVIHIFNLIFFTYHFLCWTSFVCWHPKNICHLWKDFIKNKIDCIDLIDQYHSWKSWYNTRHSN